MKKTSTKSPCLNLDGVADRKTALLAWCAYAGKHGELKGLFQYVYHYFYFQKLNDYESANSVLTIAKSRCNRFDALCEILWQKGVNPVFSKEIPPGAKCDFSWDLSRKKAKRKIILDDLSFELVSVKEYEKMASVCENVQLKKLFEKFVLDGQIHIKTLKNMFCSLK